MSFLEQYKVLVDYQFTSSGSAAGALAGTISNMEKIPALGKGVVSALDRVLEKEDQLIRNSKRLSQSFKDRYGQANQMTRLAGSDFGAPAYKAGIQGQKKVIEDEIKSIERRLGAFGGKNKIAELRNLSSGLDALDAKMFKTGQTGAKSFDTLTASIGRTAVAMGILYQLRAGMLDAINVARELQSTTNQVAAIAKNGKYFGAGGPTFGRALRQDVRGMAAKFGTNSTDIANSVNTVYQAVDVPTREALKIVELSNKIGVATRTSVETATEILLAAKNALNLKGTDLVGVSDRLITLWKDGVLTFEQAHNALGKIFKAGSLMGAKSVEDLNTLLAMTAAVTRQGGTPERNVTELQSTLLGITDPKQRKKLQGAGIDFGRGNTTFDQNVNALMQVVNAGPDFINKNFSDARERRGLAVLSTQLPFLTAEIKKMGASAGTTQTAFEDMMRDPTKRLEVLNAHFRNLKEMIGSDLVAAISDATAPTQHFLNALDKVGDVVPGVKALGGELRALVEVLGSIGVLTVGLSASGSLLGLPQVQGGGLFGKVGANLLGLGSLAVPRLGALGAAATGAEGALMATPVGIGVGAAAVLGTAGYMAYNAHRQAQLDAAAAGAEDARRNIEDGQQALAGMTDISKSFGDAYQSYKKGEGDPAKLKADMHDLAASLVEVDKATAKTYGLDVVEKNGQKWVTINGVIADSVETLQTKIANLTVANFKKQILELSQFAQKYMQLSEMELKRQAHDKLKDDRALIGVAGTLLGAKPGTYPQVDAFMSSHFATVNGKRVPLTTALTPVPVSLSEGRGAIYPGGLTEHERQRVFEEARNTFVKEKFNIDPKALLDKNAENQLFLKMSDDQKKEWDKVQKEMNEEAKGIATNLKEGNENTKGFPGGNAGDPTKLQKEATELFERVKEAKVQIEEQIKYEKSIGAVTKENESARRSELEQQQLMPFLMQAHVIQQKDVNGETKKIFDAHKPVLEGLQRIAAEKFQQEEHERAITQASKAYATALDSAAKGIEASQKNMDRAFKGFGDAIDSLAATLDENARAGSLSDKLFEISIAGVPEEMKGRYRAAYKVNKGKADLKAAYHQFQNASILDQRAQEVSAAGSPEEYLNNMIDRQITGVENVPGQPQSATLPDTYNQYDIAAGVGKANNDALNEAAIAAAQATVGSVDNICASFLVKKFRQMGFDIPNLTTTGEVYDWMIKQGAFEVSASEMQAGDVVFSSKTGPLGGPEHVMLATGFNEALNAKDGKAVLRDLKDYPTGKVLRLPTDLFGSTLNKAGLIPPGFTNYGPEFTAEGNIANTPEVRETLEYLKTLKLKERKTALEAILTGQGAFTIPQGEGQPGKFVQFGNDIGGEQWQKNFLPLFQHYYDATSQLESGQLGTTQQTGRFKQVSARNYVDKLVDLMGVVSDFSQQFNDPVMFKGKDTGDPQDAKKAKENAMDYVKFLNEFNSQFTGPEMDDMLSFLENQIADPNLAASDRSGFQALQSFILRSRQVGVNFEDIVAGKIDPTQIAQLAVGDVQQYEASQINSMDDPAAIQLANALGLNADFWQKVYGDNAIQIEAAFSTIQPAIRRLVDNINKVNNLLPGATPVATDGFIPDNPDMTGADPNVPPIGGADGVVGTTGKGTSQVGGRKASMIGSATVNLLAKKRSKFGNKTVSN